MVFRQILLVLAILFVTACGREEAALPNGVTRLSEQFTGEFSLVGKSGETVNDEDFEGKVMLVYFGFTQCPDVCPGDIGVMSAALNSLGGKASEVAPVFISVDPERDTPEALTDYFAFDERIVPLTGGDEASAEARKSFKIYAQKNEMPDSALGYTIDHTRFFYVADRSGQPRYALLGGATPEELAALLRYAIAEKA